MTCHYGQQKLLKIRLYNIGYNIYEVFCIIGTWWTNKSNWNNQLLIKQNQSNKTDGLVVYTALDIACKQTNKTDMCKSPPDTCMSL